MRIEQHVVNAWADKIASRIIKKAIADLKNMNSGEMLSGDGSGLKNVWEEVCVQVQDEQSFYWDTYEEAIGGQLARYVELLDQEERLALWLVTEEGWDYVYDHHADDEGVDDVPVCEDDIVRNLKEKMWSTAGCYTNPRIIKFINPRTDV